MWCLFAELCPGEGSEDAGSGSGHDCFALEVFCFFAESGFLESEFRKRQVGNSALELW